MNSTISAPTSVSAAASSGNSRDLLIALRDRIARDIDDEKTAARDIASLSRRLMEINHELEALNAREQEDGNDDVPDEPFDPETI